MNLTADQCDIVDYHQTSIKAASKDNTAPNNETVRIILTLNISSFMIHQTLS